MAESMTGLKRSHRCTEVSREQIGQTVTRDGLGTEAKKFGELDLRGLEGQKRHLAADV